MHKDDAVHTRTPARGSDGYERSGSGSGSSSNSGIDSDAPASISRIHDVFAEYEGTFGLFKLKHKAVRSAPHSNPESEPIVGSILRAIIRGEPRVAVDDGVSGLEQDAEAVRDDTAHLSKRGIENTSTFRSKMEIRTQDIEILGASSKGESILTGDYRLGKFLPPRC